MTQNVSRETFTKISNRSRIVSRETLFALFHGKHMTHNSEIGKIGEDLACEYLKDKKYKILERNHRRKWGELDIVAVSPNKILVFVEVKTMRQYGNAANDILPEENLTKAKLEKVKKTSELFAGKHPELIDEKKGWRIDLIAITLTDNENKINHYENI